MRLIWAEEAVELVDNTADYIEEQFGVARSIQFYDEVLSRTDELKKHPHLGPIDEDLAGGKYEYRSLGIGGLSRLIYRIDGETIRILYLWNTRKDPLKLVEMFV